MNIEYKNAVERIQKIHEFILKNKENDHTGAWIMLFYEFNRRLAHWVKTLNNDASGYGIWIDIAYTINPSWNVEDISVELEKRIDTITKYSSFLKYYLNWEKHKIQIKQLGFDVTLNPYEPIILFFELGRGWIHNDGTGYYEIGNDKIKRFKIEDLFGKPELITINKESLDKVDNEYLQNRDAFFSKYGLNNY